MKLILTIATLLLCAAPSSRAADPAPPVFTPAEEKPAAPPAPPVAAPQPGHTWSVRISGQADDAADGETLPEGTPDRSAAAVEGVMGERLARVTLELADGTRSTWFLAGDKLLFERNGRGFLKQTGDDRHDAARSFETSGFPGVHWARPDTFTGDVVVDASGRLYAVHKQEPAPFREAGGVMVPTGPSVEVTAYFDYQTGLPHFAVVGGRHYLYKINKGEPARIPMPESIRELGAEEARRLDDQRKAREIILRGG